MAALGAVDAGILPSQIVIFERNDRLGKKLMLTGNGRCNLTNLADDLSHFHGEESTFAQGALLRFTVDQTITYFEQLGLLTTEEAGKVYPLSLHASSVLDCLRMALNSRGIQVVTAAKVINCQAKNNSFSLTLEDQSKYSCAALIITTGGMCAPNTGSDGNGYKLLQNFGHTLVTPLPAIVQLKTSDKFCKPLSGNKIRGAAQFLLNGRLIRREEGEILFTDYGLSGPPILQLSGFVSRALAQKHTHLVIELDFLPGWSRDEVLTMLYLRQQIFQKNSLEEFLIGIFQRRLAYSLLRQATTKALSAEVSLLTAEELEELAKAIKGLPITISGTMGFPQAQTTAGGIRTRDFDPVTLESKFKTGLFAAGEVLDIDGDCGGYNLQWAWSSGQSAGKGAANYLRKQGRDHKNGY